DQRYQLLKFPFDNGPSNVTDAGTGTALRKKYWDSIPLAAIVQSLSDSVLATFYQQGHAQRAEHLARDRAAALAGHVEEKSSALTRELGDGESASEGSPQRVEQADIGVPQPDPLTPVHEMVQRLSTYPEKLIDDPDYRKRVASLIGMPEDQLRVPKGQTETAQELTERLILQLAAEV